MTDATRPTDAYFYEANHRHPVNRALHAVGIPVIVCASVATVFGPTIGVDRRSALLVAATGSALLFIGHAIEGNRPAIFKTATAVPAALRWWGRGITRWSRRTFMR